MSDVIKGVAVMLLITFVAIAAGASLGCLVMQDCGPYFRGEMKP